MTFSNRAVFLDRDGVINRAIVKDGKPVPPDSLKNLVIHAGVDSALRSLREADWLLIVVTNQPDVARGKTPLEEVEAINAHLRKSLAIDAFYTCYHDDSDCCTCRKPMPGLLVKAAECHGIDLAKSYMIGDRWRDIDAGVSAGCTTIFIDHQYSERKPKNFNHRAYSLAEAADIILRG